MNSVKQSLEVIEETAAAWAVRRAAGLTPEAEAEFERWLDADPRHYAAFAEADLALSVLTPATKSSDRETLKQELAAWESSRRAARSKRIMFGVTALTLAAAAAIAFLVFPFGGGWHRDQKQDLAVMACPLVRVLPDGSKVELNSNADINVNYSPDVRDVQLVRGEAHFSVAKDAKRPFVVSVGLVKVRAVGTEFDVRVGAEAVDVLVTEGVVRVHDSTTAPGPAANEPGAAPREIELAAGHRAVVPLVSGMALPVAIPVSSEDVHRNLAWRGMRFELSNATLEQALVLFNQKGRTQLVIGDPELRGLHVSGIYWADNASLFAELLESSLNIRAVHEGADRIVLRRP